MAEQNQNSQLLNESTDEAVTNNQDPLPAGIVTAISSCCSTMAEGDQSSQQLNESSEAVTNNQNPLPAGIIEAQNVEDVHKNRDLLPAATQAEKQGRQNDKPEEVMYKNRLQEFTQRSCMNSLPVYNTFNEGSAHPPLFRSSVFVDGSWYTSPATFSNKRAAEQDAAKVALLGVKEKMNHFECPLIREDTVFCKSMVIEYAVKKKLEKPIFKTVQSERLLPVFKSTVDFNGEQYVGEIGQNKKLAEQMAARAAVKSILETDSGTTMLEIIKSKRKLYAALDKVQNTGDLNAGFTPMELSHPVLKNKRKATEAIDGAGETSTSVLASGEVAPPAVSVHSPVHPSLLCSNSGEKCSPQNKENAKNGVQDGTQ